MQPLASVHFGGGGGGGKTMDWKGRKFGPERGKHAGVKRRSAEGGLGRVRLPHEGVGNFFGAFWRRLSNLSLFLRSEKDTFVPIYFMYVGEAIDASACSNYRRQFTAILSPSCVIYRL